MTDITCCKCGSLTRGIEHLIEGKYLTMRSGFLKSAGISCDNCGHDFCEECKEDESYELGTIPKPSP